MAQPSVPQPINDAIGRPLTRSAIWTSKDVTWGAISGFSLFFVFAAAPVTILAVAFLFKPPEWEIFDTSPELLREAWRRTGRLRGFGQMYS